MNTTTNVTPDEMFESLNGFDELAIERHFGNTALGLTERHPTMFLRALIFVHKNREGLSPTEAHNAAMALSLKEAQAYFSDEDEVMPDEPETESGKEDSQLD